MIAGSKYLLTALFLSISCAAQDKAPPRLFDRIEVYWKARNYPRAIEILQQALSDSRKSGNLPNRYEALLWLSTAYEASGDTLKAIAAADERLTLLRENQAHFPRALYGVSPAAPFKEEESNILERLGLFYSKLENHALAVKYLRQSVADYPTMPAGGLGSGLSNVLRSLGMTLYRSGDYAGAEKAFQESLESRRTNLDLLSDASGSIAEGDVEILRWIVRALVAQKRTDEALVIAQTSRAGALGRELQSRYGVGKRDSMAPLSLDQIKALARAEHSTLVEYSLAYEMNPVLQLQFSDYRDIPVAAVYIWVVTPAGQVIFRQVQFEKKPLALAELVGQARNSIGVRGLAPIESASDTHSKSPHNPIPTTRSGPETKQILQQLYRILIDPIADLLPIDPGERIVFIPEDLLYIVPFAALQDRSGNYLIQKHTVATEISMETLLLERRRFDMLPRSAGAALIVGNPKMPVGIPQLPGAEQESKAIAGLLGADALTGPQATKTAVLRRAQNARIIHLATHGLLNGSEELMSSLILAPGNNDSGYLSAKEIGNQTLNAEMAVLSACDTGQGKVTGDGVVGLARSFVEAGVPSLVVSLWSIPDAPTSAFMVDFYTNLRSGQDKAQSLRSAMLSTMKRYPEPVSWAAFILIGVPEASPSLRSVHGNPSDAVRKVESFKLPVPQGVTAYDETIDGETKEIRWITFESSLSRDNMIHFYSQALAALGLIDDGNLFMPDGKGLTKRFHDPQRNRDVELIGSTFQGKTTWRVSIEQPIKIP